MDAHIVLALADALGVQRTEAQKIARQGMGYIETPNSQIEYIVNLEDLTPEGNSDYDAAPQAHQAAQRAATAAAKSTYKSVMEALRGVRRDSPGTVPGAGPVDLD